MFQHRTFLTLLTAAMIGVQAVGMGLAARCGEGDSCCGTSHHAKLSCCGSEDQSSCSATTGCCCGGSAGSKCSTACSCGEHEPEPATPCESQTKDDLRQLLAHAICQTAVVSSVTSCPQLRAVEPSDYPVVKAGVNAMLCVWLT